MIKMPRLIGLYSSVAQSGKSQVANILAGYDGVSNLKFAAPLKRMARVLFASHGIDLLEIEEMVEGKLKEVHHPKLGCTPRHIMQTLGTEWGRDCIDKDFWVNAALSHARVMREKGFHVVIDDMRFSNEYVAILKNGGHVWKIERPGAPKPATGHPSEGLLDDFPFDRVIVNNGSLDDLCRKVVEAWGA
jgi:hypothetical protein